MLYFLVKELCCACLISPFMLLLLFANGSVCLMWIQQQAAGPTCGGRGPDPQVCSAEVEGHYKHMKDPIMYFL